MVAIVPTGPPPPMDPADLFLMGDSSSLAAGGVLPSTAGVTDRKDVQVSWLRRTEYLSSEASSKLGGPGLGSPGCVWFPASLRPCYRLITQAHHSLHTEPAYPPQNLSLINLAILAALPFPILSKLARPFFQNYDILPRNTSKPSNLGLSCLIQSCGLTSWIW